MRIKGGSILIATGVTAGSLSPIAANTNCTLEINGELIETAGSSAKAREFIPGLYDWSMTSNSMLTAFAASGNHVTLTSKLIAGTKVRVAFQCALDSTHNETYTGWAYIQTATLAAPVKNSATYDVVLKGTGELEIVQTQPIVITQARAKYIEYDTDSAIPDDDGNAVVISNGGTKTFDAFNIIFAKSYYDGRRWKQKYFTGFNILPEIVATVSAVEAQADILSVDVKITDTDNNVVLYTGSAEQVRKDEEDQWCVDTDQNLVWYNADIDVVIKYAILGQVYTLTNKIKQTASSTPA